MTESNTWGTLAGVDAVSLVEGVPSNELSTRPRLLVSRDILAWNAASRVAPLRFRRQNWDIVRDDNVAPGSERHA